MKGTTVVTTEEARRAVERGWHSAKLIGPNEDGSRHLVLDLSKWACVRDLGMYLAVVAEPDAAVVRLIEDGAHVELEGELYVVEDGVDEFTREIARRKMEPPTERLKEAPPDFWPAEGGKRQRPRLKIKRHEDACAVCRAYLAARGAERPGHVRTGDHVLITSAQMAQARGKSGVVEAQLDGSLANWFEVMYDEPIADALFAKSFPRNATHCTFRACELHAESETARGQAAA